MNKTILISTILIVLFSCTNNTGSINEKRENDSIQKAIELKREELSRPLKIYFDTTGTNCPIDVLSVGLFIIGETSNNDNYNNSKYIKLKYRNISNKTIVAVSFSANAVERHGKPVRVMGRKGFDGVAISEPKEEILKPGDTRHTIWSIRNNHCSKIQKANALRVVFQDGEVWDLLLKRRELIESEIKTIFK